MCKIDVAALMNRKSELFVESVMPVKHPENSGEKRILVL